MVKKILKVILGIIIALLLIILIKTILLKSRQINADPVSELAIQKKSITNLSEAIRFKTISNIDTSKVDWDEFKGFMNFIVDKYPLVDSFLNKEVINNYSLLYKWNGSNPELKPAILVSHYDVVPVEEESLDEWSFNPFSGIVDDGFIWGRGTMDDKISVIGILEAIESLLETGFQPERTFYIAIGHDEEVTGFNGGLQTAKFLDANNVNAEYVLDEGMIIVKDQVPGIKKDVALIGLSEKGFMSVELSVNMNAGHSAMPPEETAIGVMSGAIVKLRENQFKARVSEPIRGFFDYMGPEMPFSLKAVFANTWLFEKIILGIYQGKPASNALVKTTTSPTIFNSGIQDNVLPLQARATINFRILPGETSNSTLEHIKRVINDDRIVVEPYPGFSEPSPVSPIDSYGFKAIEKTIRQIFPDALVSPSLVNATTDSRHYTRLTNNVYRFLPYIAEEEDLERFHGINERLEIDAFRNTIRFYYQLIKNSNN